MRNEGNRRDAAATAAAAAPSLSAHTWRPPSLPFLPRSKQFDTREHVELAGLLVCAFAVARAAAAAAGICLLPLPRLPLLPDQGAGDGRCTGHAARRGPKQAYASPGYERRGRWVRRWGGVGGKGRGLHHPRLSLHHTPAAAVSRPPSRSSIGAPKRVMEVVREIL